LEFLTTRGFRAIAPDLRGYGETTVVPGVTTLDQFASDLGRLLDHLKLDVVTLIGLSMGGQIVMECYRLFPQRVGRLVLCDTSARAETEEGRKIRVEMAERLIREGMRPYALEVLPKMIAPYNIQALPQVAEHVLDMMLATSPVGAAAALRGRAERPDYLEILGRVAVPTLVIVGADDEFTPVAEAHMIHEQIDGSELLVIERSAHMPNLEQEHHFNEGLMRFLKEHAD